MAKQKLTSRRDFLKGVGIAATGVAASAALSGCSSKEECSCGDAQISPTGTTDGGCPPTGLGTGGSEAGGAGAAGTGGGAGGAGGSSTQQQTGSDASCPPVTQCATPATLPSQWDKEADVVVLGTGFAGLATAIVASDAGAKVLILEKMPQAQEGGNSIVSGNIWWTPTSVDEGVTYIKAMCMGLTDDTCIQTLAQEMSTVNTWLSSTLGISAPLATGIFQPEYPELPGSGSVRVWSNMLGGGLWTPLRTAVTSRSIEVLYETPAVDLIQDPSTREIKGVIATSGGKNINIKAKRAVVLACGGFEYGFDIQAQHLPGWPVYGQGSPGNTGDGIKMAQKAGAALWHMNNALAHVGCFVPDPNDPKSIPIPLSLANGCILVDKFGSRFMNEKIVDRHGFGHKEFLFFFDGLKQSFNRIPCYGVFDETTRRAGTLVGGLMGWYGKVNTYSWSADNSAEISKGWIKQGQTWDALATAFGADSATLNATVTRYNGFCTGGNDQDFGRSAATLQALTTAPYYAIPIYPMMYNTQGGPRRNEKCQIIDPFSAPIPRLYSAGELGSFWGWMYNGGGNACECLCTGRIAGKNAAGEGPWA